MDSVIHVWLHVIELHYCLRVVGLTRCKDFNECSIFPGPVSTWRDCETLWLVHIISVTGK